MAAANGKFKRRFEAVEAALGERRGGLAEATLEEMEDAWQETKRAERIP
jgi:nucleoside triphosphate diphosphatase